MGKINVYEKIMIETQKKNYGHQFLYKSPSNRWFRNVVHSLLSEDDARESADIIY